MNRELRNLLTELVRETEKAEEYNLDLTAMELVNAKHRLQKAKAYSAKVAFEREAKEILCEFICAWGVVLLPLLLVIIM